MKKIDSLTMAHLTRSTEKGCWKLCKGNYDFSPEVKDHLDRCHTYRGLLRIASGRQRKWGNIVQFVERCGIRGSKKKNRQELVYEYLACIDHTK